MYSADRARIAKEDISELETVFDSYHDFGDLVQGLKKNIGTDQKRSLQIITELKKDCRFELLPPELEESLKDALDSLERTIRGKDREAYREMKESREDLQHFINKDEETRISEWDSQVLKSIASYKGEHVIRKNGKYKVLDVGIRKFISKIIWKNTGVDKSLIKDVEVAKSLQNYEKTVEVTYGLEKHNIAFTVCGNSPEMVETTARSLILEQLDFEHLKKETREVNSAISNVIEAKEAVMESGFPRYGELNGNPQTDKMKNYVAEVMMNTAEQILNIQISASPEDIAIDVNTNIIGYKGKNRNGKWVLNFGDEETKGTLFDLIHGAENKSVEELVDFIDNAPMGFEGTGDDHTPSKAPDVFMVDLVHEIGHAVSDIAAEEVYHGGTVQENYKSLIDQEIGSRRFEEAANELAAITLKRLAGNLGGDIWKEIEKGFEGYLELTRYDRPKRGYRAQHPIHATKNSIRELYGMK